MSKYDSEIRAAAEVSGEFDDLLGGLGQQPRSASARHDAMAHFLSGAEGWRDARKRLGGAFSAPTPDEGDGHDEVQTEK